jgi:hypothetical protein
MRFARLSTAVLSLAALAATATAQPKIQLGQSSWDFGKVWHNEKTEFKLEITNAGDENLVIENVRTTCGCTAATPALRTILPGRSTSMTVAYDTHGKQGDVTSKVIITSNDPTQREVNFLVKGHVKRAITRDPLGGLVIRTLDPSAGQTGACRLENQVDEPMNLRVVATNLPMLDIEIKEITPGVRYDIIGKTNRHLRPGTIRGEIDFATGIARETQFTLHARIQVLTPVTPVPAAMLFRGEDRSPARRIVSLHYYGTENPSPDEFEVISARADHPEVRINIGRSEAPQAWMQKMDPPINSLVRAQVLFPAPSEFPPDGIRLQFQTNCPAQPVLELLATTSKEAFERETYGPSQGPKRPVGQ